MKVPNIGPLWATKLSLLMENGKTIQLKIAQDKENVIKGIIKNSSTTQTRVFYGVQFAADAQIVKKLLDRFIVEL